MKRNKVKPIIFLAIIYVVLSVCILILLPKNQEYRYIDFISGESSKIELADSAVMHQTFFKIPVNTMGLSFRIMNELNCSGVLNFTLYESDDKGNNLVLVETQTIAVDDIGGNAPEYYDVLWDFGYMGMNKTYSVDISFDGKQGDTISLFAGNNQSGIYANRWDVNNEPLTLNTRFIQNSFSPCLYWWLILTISYLAITYIALRKDDTNESPESKTLIPIYKVVAYVSIFVIAFILLGHGVTKETFSGDYLYQEISDWNISNDLDGEVVSSQSFTPQTEELTRIFLPQEGVSQNAIISLCDSDGQVLKEENVQNLSVNEEKYVFEVYENSYDSDRTYRLEIESDNAVNVTNPVNYQYKPLFNWGKFVLYLICFGVVILIMLFPIRLPALGLSKAVTYIILLFVAVLSLSVTLYPAYQRYRTGETWRFVISYTSLYMLLGAMLFISALARVLPAKSSTDK